MILVMTACGVLELVAFNFKRGGSALYKQRAFYNAKSIGSVLTNGEG